MTKSLHDAGGLSEAELSFWLTGDCIINELHLGGKNRWESHWRLATCYAKTLYELVMHSSDQQIQLQIVGYGLCLALKDQDLNRLLGNPAVDVRERATLWMDCALMLTSKFRLPDQPPMALRIIKMLSNLSEILIKRRLCYILPNIISHYQAICFGQHRICRVKVWSAAELKKEQSGMLKDYLSECYHLHARLQIYIEPKILGGLIIEIFNRRIDNSLLSILQRLQKFWTTYE